MKRYYIKIMLLFFLFSTLFSVLSVKADLPLQGKVIVVDAGHGRYCYSTQRIKTIRTS